LPKEIQFLVSWAFKPDSRLTISTNFDLREVRTAAYDEQQTHLQPVMVVVNHGIGRWISMATKID
jgi:hypothetical protein